MATEVTNIIDPDMGSGYDYDSLFDWEAAEQADLTSTDEIAIAKCRCTGGTADSTGVTIDGWVTSATQYVKIWTDPAESYRHSGKWDDTKYRLTSSAQYGNVLYVVEDYVKVFGLQIKHAAAADRGSGVYFYVSTGNSSLFHMDSMIVWQAGRGASSATHVVKLRGGYSIVSNSLIGKSMDAEASGLSILYVAPVTSAYVYNCTSVSNLNHGFNKGAGSTLVIKNCYSGNNSGSDYYNSPTLTTCASEDTTGTSGLQEIAYSVSAGAYFTNVTEGSEDFHIGATSALIGAGTNLYNDATYAFQTDIDGNDRGGNGASWDIGADEYMSVGTTLPLFRYLYSNSLA